MTTLQVAVIGVLLMAWSGDMTAQNTTQKEQQVIRQAIADASNRLNQQKCANFYGSGALEVLQTAQFQMAPVGPPLPRPGSSGKFQRTVVVIAVTYRQFHLVIVNRLGPFLEPGKPIGGQRYNKRLSDSDFRSLVVLHELGHLTAKFNAEGSYDTTNEEHTDTVLRNCFSNETVAR